MDTTRRNFVGAIAAALAIPSIGTAESNDWFEDLKVDRYYTLQRGPHKDTGGWGCPYPSMGNEIVKNMKFWEHCRELEDKLDEVESRGFYLSQSQYFGKPYREYEKIPPDQEVDDGVLPQARGRQARGLEEEVRRLHF